MGHNVRSTNAKVKIYVPLFVGNRQHEQRDLTTFCAVESEEVNSIDAVNYNLIAKRIRAASAYSLMQVGTSMKEVRKILGQHSYYKDWRNAYAVQVLVDANDLSGPMTEAQMVNIKNAVNVNRYNSFLVLNLNANIIPENIIKIKLAHPFFSPFQLDHSHDLHDSKINPAVTGDISYNSISVIAYIKSFINDFSFWQNHVHGLSALSFELVPPGIKPLQALFSQNKSIQLSKIKEIAEKYYPQKDKSYLSKVTSGVTRKALRN